MVFSQHSTSRLHIKFNISVADAYYYYKHGNIELYFHYIERAGMIRSELLIRGEQV